MNRTSSHEIEFSNLQLVIFEGYMFHIKVLVLPLPQCMRDERHKPLVTDDQIRGRNQMLRRRIELQQLLEEWRGRFRHVVASFGLERVDVRLKVINVAARYNVGPVQV